MANRDDDGLDRKLARGGLSGPEKDRILERVLEGVPEARAADRRRWFRMPAVLVAAAGAAAAMALVLVADRDGGGPATEAKAGNAFRAKGADEGGPAVDVACAHHCRPGDTILFRVGHLDTAAYLNAFAEAPDGERIWYFPSEASAAPRLEPTDGMTIVPRGVRLGPEHGPGPHAVHVVLTSERVPRPVIDAAAAGHGVDAAVIAHRQLRLEVRP